MKTIDLSCWEDYIKCIDEFDDSGSEHKKKNLGFLSNMIFRGQSNSDWKLSTTLERYSKDTTDVKRYYNICLVAKNQIEAYTNHNLDIPDPEQYNNYIEEKGHNAFSRPIAYEFLVHLRHFGFPSPLLDWTRSPYIAAFFAFSGCTPADNTRIAIFAFREYAGSGKIGLVGAPAINTHGSNIRSHRRHFIQQSEYTTCVEMKGKTWHYADHESIVSRNSENQDIFWKITLPAAERFKVLHILDRHNLNEHSLYGSEESLMSTIALREFYFRGQNYPV